MAVSSSLITSSDESQTPSSTSSCVDRQVHVSSADVPEITLSSDINDATSHKALSSASVNVVMSRSIVGDACLKSPLCISGVSSYTTFALLLVIIPACCAGTSPGGVGVRAEMSVCVSCVCFPYAIALMLSHIMAKLEWLRCDTKVCRPSQTASSSSTLM